MTYTTSDGGPFSYIAWLPQDYGDRPSYGARLIINYNYGYNMGPHSVCWVGDRQTWAGPDYLRKAFWAKAQPLVQKAFKIINLPENSRMVETQQPEDRSFRVITESSVQGLSVYYCCAHGYCYFVAVETD